MGHEFEGLLDLAFEVLHARFQLLVHLDLGLLQVLHPCQEVGMAVDEFADAEYA